MVTGLRKDRKEDQMSALAERMALMKTRMLWIVMLGLFALTASVMAVPPPYTGVVSVDSAQVLPGTHFSLKVNLTNNNLGLSALTVPLKFYSANLTLDSVSFAHSFVTADFGSLSIVDNNLKTVKITIVPNVNVNPIPVLNVTSGIIAELFFRVSSPATSETVTIDSLNTDNLVTYNGQQMHVWTRIEVSDNTGEGSGLYVPTFVAGQVKVMVPTGVNDDHGNLLPTAFSLDQNYPNPFNPSTVIKFELPKASHVSLEVFNVLGQKVTTLANGRMDAGTHEIQFDATSQPSGIFFYRLTYDGGSETKKMILVK
jgi:hypothetical protein